MLDEIISAGTLLSTILCLELCSLGRTRLTEIEWLTVAHCPKEYSHLAEERACGCLALPRKSLALPDWAQQHLLCFVTTGLAESCPRCS